MALAVGDEIVAAAVSNEAQIDWPHITIKSFGLYWNQFKTRSFLGTFREMSKETQVLLGHPHKLLPHFQTTQSAGVWVLIFHVQIRCTGYHHGHRKCVCFLGSHLII